MDSGLIYVQIANKMCTQIKKIELGKQNRMR